VLSLILPVWNEARRVEAGVRGALELRRLIADAGLGQVEIIVVDDGSTDDTAARAAAALGDQGRVLGRPHGGKGAALFAGLAAAQGDRCLFNDIDWSVSPPEVLRLLCREGELVLAVREGPAARRMGEPPGRHLIGRIFNRLVQWAVLAGHEDTQCGCKVIDRRAALALLPQLHERGWAYDVELLVAAHAHGLHIVEHPVAWRFEQETRLRPGRDGLGMAAAVWRIRQRQQAGAYGPRGAHPGSFGP